MGKAADKLAEKAGHQRPEAPAPEDHCQVCQWHFETDNKRPRFFSRQFPLSRRTEPRVPIVTRSHGMLYTRCDICWQKEQWIAGKHPQQGSMAEENTRAALFSEFRGWDDIKRRAAVFNDSTGRYEFGGVATSHG